MMKVSLVCHVGLKSPLLSLHRNTQITQSRVLSRVTFLAAGRASNGSIRLPRCSLRDRFDFRLISELGCTTGILSSWYSVHSSLWGKSQCEVAASIIRRLQNTSSCTGSESECRDAVSLACSQRRCEESPSSKLQMRVSSEDSRTPFRGHAAKQSAEMRSVLHAPIDVVG